MAVLVDVLTDNKLRTVSEVRNIFNKNNGSMGEAGCVAWNFETKGLIAIEKSAIEEEKLMELALDAGADDIKDEGATFEILADTTNFETVPQSHRGCWPKTHTFSDREAAQINGEAR